METYSGQSVAVTDLRLAEIRQEHFAEMLGRMPEVGKRLVARMTDRVRESSRTEVQREKMMSLGKLSAGLAHELNNPAAAIRRSVADLRQRMEAMPALVTRLTGHGLTPDQVEAARAALQSCTAPTPGTVSVVARSEREDALSDWLEDHDVAGAYVVAEVLADEGVTTDALDRPGGRGRGVGARRHHPVDREGRSRATGCSPRSSAPPAASRTWWRPSRATPTATSRPTARWWTSPRALTRR